MNIEGSSSNLRLLGFDLVGFEVYFRVWKLVFQLVEGNFANLQRIIF